jgi:hypothetical protein
VTLRTLIRDIPGSNSERDSAVQTVAFPSFPQSVQAGTINNTSWIRQSSVPPFKLLSSTCSLVFLRLIDQTDDIYWFEVESDCILSYTNILLRVVVTVDCGQIYRPLTGRNYK